MGADENDYQEVTELREWHSMPMMSIGIRTMGQIVTQRSPDVLIGVEPSDTGGAA
jgi:hypothetical protein